MQDSGDIGGFGLSLMAGVLYRMTTLSTQQSFEVSVTSKSCIERSELIARADEFSRAI